MRISDWSSDVCSSDLELRPGTETSSDDEIVDYIRQSGQTSYHPIGTCKMGNDDLAVVDDRLRVRGIDRLRVVDASIMPTLRSAEHTSELQSLMRISYAVFCFKKKKHNKRVSRIHT